jgi:hypothetical protein
MLPVVRAMVRGVGWLLTPAIVAVVSAGALWLAARFGTGLDSAGLALAVALGSAFGAGAAVFLWWVLSLRHARRHARRWAADRASARAQSTTAPSRSLAETAGGSRPTSVDEAAD